MNDLAARWGHLIRSKRKTADLSQVELGARIGRPQSVISRWERGLHSPTMRDQERLMSALNITAEELAEAYAGGEAA